MLHFANPQFFYALGLIPLCIIIYMMARSWKKKALNRMGDSRIIQLLMPDSSKTKPLVKLIFLCLAFTFLIIGIATPQIGSKMEEVKREGVDLMIALDLSNSMKAEDIIPNRLENAKLAIEKLIDNLGDDRIGIVVFGGEAYTQLPITTDYSAAKLFLANIDTDIIPTQGTAIGAAIDLAINSFDKKSVANKAIIVITDGENHEDDAVKAAEKAAAQGIIVHTIGMGSENGAPIPIYENGKASGYKKDRDGNTVVTKLNETMLQQIAAAGKGIYARASNSQSALNTVFNEINKMQKKEIGSKVYKDYEDHFQYFIAVALLLFLLEIFISERKSKWWQKLNLFGTKDQAN